MKLAKPTDRYDRGYEDKRNRDLEAADRDNVKRDADIEMVNGKVILRSANGTRYYLVVSNAGVLSTTVAP